MKKFLASLLCHKTKSVDYPVEPMLEPAEDRTVSPSRKPLGLTSSLKRTFSGKYQAMEKIQAYLVEAKSKFLVKYNQSNQGDEGEGEDFEQVRTLGTGSFGRVVLVKHVTNGHFFAMKILSKEKVVKLDQVEHTLNEKHLLHSVSFPFLVNLKYHFKDNSYLYMVLEFVPGGELFSLLHRSHYFSERQAQFYAAQIVLVFEYLHYLDILYRDLKPENILIAADGYLKLADFGFAKRTKDRTYSLCGTPEYMAPEMIASRGYSKAVDWWACGVLIFEMLAGYSPFYAESQLQLCQNIIAAQFRFPEHFSAPAKDLVSHLLELDVTKRYGNLRNAADDVKKHAWFRTTDWMEIFHRKVKAPYVPTTKGSGDASHFDTYEEESLLISSQDRYKKEFQDF